MDPAYLKSALTLSNESHGMISDHAKLMVESNLDAFLFVETRDETTYWEKNTMTGGFKQARVEPGGNIFID